MNEYIEYDDLQNGVSIVVGKNNAMLEKYGYDAGEFNRLYTKKVKLPNNVDTSIILLSDGFESSISMLDDRHFLIPSRCRKIFEPSIYRGQFVHGKISINNNMHNKSHNEFLKENNIKYKLINSRHMNNSQGDTIMDASSIYNSILGSFGKLSIRGIYENFYKYLCKTIDEIIINVEEDHKKILIIDIDKFSFKSESPIKENITNPLFILYLAYYRHKTLSKLDITADILIAYNDMFIKINPDDTSEKDWPEIRRAIYKIMKSDVDDYVSKSASIDRTEIEPPNSDELLAQSSINDTISPFTTDVAPSVKNILSDKISKKVNANIIASASKLDDVEKEVNDSPLEVFPSNDDIEYKPLVKNISSVSAKNIDNNKDYINSITSDVMDNDKEVAEELMDNIQDRIVPLKELGKAPLNSERDKKLREKQKKIVVANSTIEEILMRDSINVPIKTDNKSAVMHTSNKNMHDITFANFEKTYIDEMLTKDIVSCFDMLKDKNTPFYITGVDIKDSSTVMDLKETWTVNLVDENGKRSTIKVDIPKFYNDKFMLIGGVKYVILKQNFYYPLVKDTPDTVILTTNYNKITITRRATKSLSSVERLFSLMKKLNNREMFTPGNSSKSNLRYISTLEYDEISKSIFSFKNDNCELYFSRNHIDKNMHDKIPAGINDNEFFIGFEGNVPIIINEDTGKDRNGRTIIEIITSNLPEDASSSLSSINSPKQSMYSECKMAGQFMPVCVVVIAWIGIQRMLKVMDIKWEFNSGAKQVPKNGLNGMNYVRFSDGVLSYEANTFSELVMNGISKLSPERQPFSNFETDDCFYDYIHSIWGTGSGGGSYEGINQIRTFYECLIDPITKDICKDLMLPYTSDGLLLHGVRLLADNAFVSKSADTSYRARSIETIPGILYYAISEQYRKHTKNTKNVPMTLNQNVVLSKLIAEKTVEGYSTLNPVVEVGRMHTISTRGFRGSNSEYSYDEEKRSYDPTSLGKLAMSTAADANVGIARELVIEPTITNVRGYREFVDDPSTLKDINVFSPIEMLTPGAARVEDPMRTAIAGKQSQHIIPVEHSLPTLVSNGFDESIQFHLSNDFVINAEEDGEVVEVDEKVGFIVVKYKSGKTQAVNIFPEIVKNSGGGFYLSNKLTPAVTKVGDKFKKDEVLAYHDKYFKNTKMGGLRYSFGPIVKMAFMSTYNTYEDAGICTAKMSKQLTSKIVYKEEASFKKNANILSIVNIGDHVNVGDALIKYDISFEDDEISKYLTKLSEHSQELIDEETKNEIKTHHAGTIVDIKVYSLLDTSLLSTSLGKIINQYFNKGKARKSLLSKHDKNPGILKSGYLLTESTEPIVTRYNNIKKHKGIDVLIEFYIEHANEMCVGDKIALYSANKQIVSEIIGEGFEPFSEFRKDEEISVLTSPGTIARRMTPAPIMIGAANKVLIELKRKIKNEIKY